MHAVLVWLWVNCAGNILASSVTTAAALCWHSRRLRGVKAHITAELREQLGAAQPAGRPE